MARTRRPPLALLLPLGLLFFFVRPAAAQRIPAVPKDFSFIQDYADLYDAPTRAQIGTVQKAAFEQQKTPIVVVTINDMARYGWTGSIETFATLWFNAWGIGAQDTNQGILLLISVGDRKARIELGKAWGDRWDGYSQGIMNDTIVPHFKNGAFARGTVEGVQALGEMARLTPYGVPPAPGALRQIGQAWASDEKVSPLSPLGIRLALPLLAVGILCLVLACFMPDQRKWLLWIGIGLIVLALALWLIVGVVALFSRGRRGGGSGGGYSSSSGFGGGSSGGGGATGSW